MDPAEPAQFVGHAKTGNENFLAAVRGERPAPCTSEEALEDLILAQNYIDAMIKANAIQNLKF